MATVAPGAKQKVLDYIEGQPPFSRAICKKLRSIILKADKEIVEDWKWGPHYAAHGMVCGIGAFKEHVKLHFFNGAAMSDRRKMFNHCVDTQFSRSIKYTSVKEINEQALIEYVQEAVQVNRQGFKRQIKDKTVEVPEDLQVALAKKKTAQKFFDSLSYGYRKEFVEWVTSAKRVETRNDRIAKVVAMCAEGRKLHDKYRQ